MTSTILLVTRPRDDAERFVQAIEAAQGRPVRHNIAPLLKIVPLEAEVPACAGLVLTSRHGVAAAVRFGLPTGLPAYCVGAATAIAATDAGFKGAALGGSADAMVVALAQARPKGPLLHLHGVHTRGDVAARLTACGIITESRAVYGQEPVPLGAEADAMLSGPDPVVAPVFSPRSAQLLADALPPGAKPIIVAISPAAAAVFADRGLDVVTAERADLAAMIDLTARQLAASGQTRGSA